MKICPHAVRVLENWGNEKKQTQKAIQKSQLSAQLSRQGLKSPQTIILQDGSNESPVSIDKRGASIQTQNVLQRNGGIKASLSHVSRRLPLQVKVAKAPEVVEDALPTPYIQRSDDI